MKIKHYVCMLAAVAALGMSCSDDDTDDAQDPNGPPVENNPPNTSYQPAFEGQTRAPGATTETDYTAAVVTTGLQSPWGVASLPDGRLLVTQKGGTMRIVTTTGTVSSPITGIPAVSASGQGGLLGLCLDPQFASNRMVYWAFSENVSGGTHTSVAKGRLSDSETTIENPIVIYRTGPAYGVSALHYGGRVAFDRDGNLFVSSGERSDLATRPLAQSVTASLGKIIRITKDGQPAPGNPTFSGTGALPELYSIGHRNPQGIAIHPETGELWQAEHGPRGGDEVNHVRPGNNYGWPTITYGIEYSGATIGEGITQQVGLEQPVYYWDPVISPSGITFYKGDRVPEWKNNLFLASLSGKHLCRLVFNSSNRVIGEERLLADQNQRFRDVTQGADNALYAVTDEGRLYRIDRAADDDQ